MLTQSDSINEIVTALIKARKEIVPAKKKEKSHYGKYADLKEVIDCSLPILLTHGLFVSQQPVLMDAQPMLKTQVSHVSGQWMCSFTLIINGKPNDPQAQGSAISYSRRYGYEALFSMEREDDDGQSAMPTPSKAKKDYVAKLPLSPPADPPPMEGPPAEPITSTGAPVSNPSAPAASEGEVLMITKGQIGLLKMKFIANQFTDDQGKAWLNKYYGVESTKNLPRYAVSEIIKHEKEGTLVPLLDTDDDIPF